ncbi:Rhodanese-like domain-containing protein [Gamsiella multidivaricata]|uniref:Rhodanese-like domain-containing protein n=1 Tax=Gamsiella multidivaricata TaxID=101098 RepID=UPI00222076E4|nr:Rhodanese-like domain-containing protein [Gamsiella multidivaricata]KAG0368176.1 hypothetical protein BGZ54_002531 [Gamsiella multidivaricata]KAI7820634.1 Rhodanese-like domain-containing protein [Gamsiella multidivaricata]
MAAPYHATTGQGAKQEEATFEEVLELSQQHGSKVPLIDVRDPNETALGIIPTAKLIPLGSLNKALVSLSDLEFENEYGFKRFDKDDEVIFYCRSGRRSRLAFGQAKELGYTRVRHYPGSWIEWEARTKGPNDN